MVQVVTVLCPVPFFCALSASAVLSFVWSPLRAFCASVVSFRLPGSLHLDTP
jgi:hypothetical protein